MCVFTLPCSKEVIGNSVGIASGTFVKGAREDARETAWGQSELIDETDGSTLGDPPDCWREPS